MLKKNIRLMYLLSFLQGMVFYGPISTLYRQAQGVTIDQITLIESICLALMILLELPWGMVADKIGYKRTFVFCCWLYFLSKLVFWQADSFGDFLAERVMLSVVYAGLSGVDTTLLYLSCGDEDSQKVFGIYESLGTAGLLSAAAVYSLWIRENYQLAGFLTVLSYGAAALLALGITDLKPRPHSGNHPAEGFREAWKSALGNPRLLIFLVAVALLSEAHQTITVFLNQLQYTACGMTAGTIGLVYIIATLVGMLGVFSSQITRKLGKPGALLTFGGAAIASCLTLAVTRSAGLSVAGILTLRLSNSLFQPLQLKIQNQSIRTQNRATALSLNAIFTDGIAIGTNLAFGQLAQHSLAGAFWFGAGISLLAFTLLFFWGRVQPQEARAEAC